MNKRKRGRLDSSRKLSNLEMKKGKDMQRALKGMQRELKEREKENLLIHHGFLNDVIKSNMSQADRAETDISKKFKVLRKQERELTHFEKELKSNPDNYGLKKQYDEALKRFKTDSKHLQEQIKEEKRIIEGITDYKQQLSKCKKKMKKRD